MPDDLSSTLERYSKIISEATPEPWELHTHGTPRQHDIWYDEFDTPLARDVFRESDGLFITASRTAMPRLVAALRAVLELADEAVLETIDASGAACSWDLNPAKVREAISSSLYGKEEADGA